MVAKSLAALLRTVSDLSPSYSFIHEYKLAIILVKFENFMHLACTRMAVPYMYGNSHMHMGFLYRLIYAYGMVHIRMGNIHIWDGTHPWLSTVIACMHVTFYPSVTKVD